ncbi:MAG TPA: hypothetical protein VFM77_08360 [Terriglobales bacterium]|nr:hypothetical protein [Terriglobales bacterium]
MALRLLQTTFIKEHFETREFLLRVKECYDAGAAVPFWRRVIGPNGEMAQDYDEMLRLLGIDPACSSPVNLRVMRRYMEIRDGSELDRLLQPLAGGRQPAPPEAMSFEDLPKTEDEAHCFEVERVLAAHFPPLPQKVSDGCPDYFGDTAEEWIESERKRRERLFMREYGSHPLLHDFRPSAELTDAELDMSAVFAAERIKWSHPELYEAALNPEKYKNYIEQNPREVAAGGVAPSAPRCRFTKADGTCCGSPALKNRRLCYFHNETTDGRRSKAKGGDSKNRKTFRLPVLEDEVAIQMAVTNVCQDLANECLDSKRASTLLYGLQVASTVLRHRTKGNAEEGNRKMC